MSELREWWADLVRNENGSLKISDSYPDKRYGDLIHVREVVPGSITITRAQLSDAWTKVSGDFMYPDCDDLIRELFGEELK